MKALEKLNERQLEKLNYIAEGIRKYNHPSWYQKLNNYLMVLKDADVLVGAEDLVLYEYYTNNLEKTIQEERENGIK